SGSLHLTRHHRITSSADRDVERWSRTTAVLQAESKADLLDKLLRLERRLDLPCAFATPVLVAKLFELVCKGWPGLHELGNRARWIGRFCHASAVARRRLCVLST